jgi:hypothetical protein
MGLPSTAAYTLLCFSTYALAAGWVLKTDCHPAVWATVHRQTHTSDECACTVVLHRGDSDMFHNHEECRLLAFYAVWLLLRTDVSEELSASFIRATRIGELGTEASSSTVTDGLMSTA